MVYPLRQVRLFAGSYVELEFTDEMVEIEEVEFEDWDEDPEVVVAVEFELGGAEEGGVMTDGDVGRKAFRPTTPATVNIAARIISIMIIAAIALKYPLFKRTELR